MESCGHPSPWIWPLAITTQYDLREASCSMVSYSLSLLRQVRLDLEQTVYVTESYTGPNISGPHRFLDYIVKIHKVETNSTL